MRRASVARNGLHGEGRGLGRPPVEPTAAGVSSGGFSPRGSGPRLAVFGCARSSAGMHTARQPFRLPVPRDPGQGPIRSPCRAVGFRGPLHLAPVDPLVIPLLAVLPLVVSPARWPPACRRRVRCGVRGSRSRARIWGMRPRGEPPTAAVAARTSDGGRQNLREELPPAEDLPPAGRPAGGPAAA